LQPAQAVQVLNDRLKYGKKLNTHIADWLQVRSADAVARRPDAHIFVQERRRVEEQYALALRKLAARPLADEAVDLG